MEKIFNDLNIINKILRKIPLKSIHLFKKLQCDLSEIQNVFQMYQSFVEILPVPKEVFQNIFQFLKSYHEHIVSK